MATTNSNVNTTPSSSSSPAKILPTPSTSTTTTTTTVQSTAISGVNDRQIKSLKLSSFLFYLNKFKYLIKMYPFHLHIV